MSSSSNSSLFPPKQGDSTSPTTSRETGLSGTTPPEIIRTYFTKEGTTYKINQPLKRLVSFGQINLSDRDQLRRVEKSQIVFCRNVIIYFDDEMKRKVIGAFYDNLEPNGMLLIGHSESLHNISRAFKPEHHTGTIVYRKLG